MITIKDLSKVFQTKDREVKAVDGLSLTINKGEIYGVIGYSGAGKSTFIPAVEPFGGSNRRQHPRR